MGVQTAYREAIIALRDGQWQAAARWLLAVMADAPDYRHTAETLVALSQARPVAYWQAAFTFAVERGARNHALAALQRLEEIAPDLETLPELRARLHDGSEPDWIPPANPIEAIEAARKRDDDKLEDTGGGWLDLAGIEAALAATPEPGSPQTESMQGVLEDLIDFDSELAAPIEWNDARPLGESAAAILEGMPRQSTLSEAMLSDDTEPAIYDTQPLESAPPAADSPAAPDIADDFFAASSVSTAEALDDTEPLEAWEIDEVFANLNEDANDTPATHPPPSPAVWISGAEETPHFSNDTVQYASPESAEVAVDAPPKLDRMPPSMRQRRRDRTLILLLAVLLVGILGAAVLLDGPLNINQLGATGSASNATIPADVSALITAVDTQLTHDDPAAASQALGALADAVPYLAAADLQSALITWVAAGQEAVTAAAEVTATCMGDNVDFQACNTARTQQRRLDYEAAAARAAVCALTECPDP